MLKIFRRDQSNNIQKFKFCVIVFFVFFLSNKMVAQESSFENSVDEISINQKNLVIENAPVRVSNSVLNSNVNFILWFMGTKEDVSKTILDDVIYSKKSIITSGREPNRLLIKTLLKKALNIKSC